MKCYRLIKKDPLGETENSVLFGIILEEKGDILKFKTARQTWLINKSEILSLNLTNREFEGNLNGLNGLDWKSKDSGGSSNPNDS